MRLGRRIYDNLRKAMAYILAVHVPIAGMSLLPVLFGLAAGAAAGAHRFPGADHRPGLLGRLRSRTARTLKSCAANPGARGSGCSAAPSRDEPVRGAASCSVLVAVFVVALYRGQGEANARALGFTTLIVANLGLIFVNRSSTRPALEAMRVPNRALWWVVGGTVLLLGLVLYVPVLRTLFSISLLHPPDIAICFAAGIASVGWLEVVKMLDRWRSRRPARAAR